MNHNKSADGLRGLAALSVVFSHFLCAYRPAYLHHFYPELYPEVSAPGVWYGIGQLPVCSIFYSGHIAVLIFFVLSGYVLAMPYYKGQLEKIPQRFWARYFRLNLPIAGVIVLSAGLILAQLNFNLQVAGVAHSSWLQHVLPAGETGIGQVIPQSLYGAIVFGKSAFDPPLWTINIEFFGSLFLLAYYAVKPRAWDGLTLLLITLLLWVRYAEASLFVIAMFAGAYLNKINPNRKILLLSLVLGIYFGGFQYDNLFYDFLPAISVWDRKTLYDTLGAILIVGAVINGVGGALLQSGPMQYLGRISYSLYLVHCLVLVSLSCKLYLELPAGQAGLAMNFVIYVGVAILAAHIFERLIDQNAIAASRKFSDFIFQKKAPSAPPAA